MKGKNFLLFTKNRIKNEHGFSLVELIVVIAVMVILIALLVPNVVGYIQKAHNVSDCNNAKTMANAVLAAMAAGDLTDYSNIWYDGSGPGSTSYDENYNHLYIYVDNDEIRCSNESIAQLLVDEKIVTGDYAMRGGVEPVFSFAAGNTKFACHSKAPWDRYQINFYDRDDSIWYTFSAFNQELMGSTTGIDTVTSELFANLAGGPADTAQNMGEY